MSLIVFVLVSFGLAFMIADARIFGCDTEAYNEAPDDTKFIWSIGFLKIRPYLLQFRFFRELFSCYFCLGTWTGPVVYYALGYPMFQRPTLLGFVLSALVSATGCYLLHSLVNFLNTVAAKHQAELELIAPLEEPGDVEEEDPLGNPEDAQ